MELAFRMQSEAPEIMSLDGESEATRALYGIGEPKTDDFGRACLLARRFAEQGVRYITLMHSTRAVRQSVGSAQGSVRRPSQNAAAVDVPIAGLLRDLKQRGMLDDTLVMCGSEFGRTPMFEYQNGAEGRLRNGRDHNPHGFTMWFAGGRHPRPAIQPRHHRRLRLLRRRGPRQRPRPARDDSPPDGDRSHEAHLSPRRPGLPADGRVWGGCEGDSRLKWPSFARGSQKSSP